MDRTFVIGMLVLVGSGVFCGHSLIVSHITHTHTHTHISGAAGSGLIPRAPTLEGSAVLRSRKGRSVNIPGMGNVKLRHGVSHSYYGGYTDPDRTPDDLMSLADFLAESEKTPNRVSW